MFFCSWAFVIHTTWEEFLKIIKEEAGSHVVDTWFKAVSFRHWDAFTKEVYLEAANSFVRDWIKAHYYSLMQVHLSRLLHVDTLKIIFMLKGEEAPAASIQLMPSAPAARMTPTVADEVSAGNSHVVVPFKKPTSIHTTHTFSTFVVGPSNSLAYAAAQAVAEKPGTLYNPLFFYGGSGLGKTHLLHAIGNDIKERNPKAIVLYQTADRFVNEFIYAIRFDKVHKFKEKYKLVDVLLIDDIQFISNKEQTQEAFFHIFNLLYDLNKQIVFSSDSMPQDLQGLAERLRSRLAWGLVADVLAPALETKIAILKKKAELSNEPLGDDVAHFIAARDIANIRELEGALVRVIAFASLTNQPLTLELAKRVLIRPQEAQSSAIDFAGIIKCLGNYYPYKLDDLRSKQRSKEISMVRQIAMFLMKKMTDKSLRDIGVFLGGRDHSTVMHALTKVEEHCKTRDEFQAHIKRLEEDILRANK